MEKEYFRYYRPKLLIITIIILSAIFGFLLDLIPPYLNGFLNKPYIHYPTVSSLIVLTLVFIDNKGIKLPVLNKLFWVKDISGRYEGEIEYQDYKSNFIKKKTCFVEVEQKASKININTYFNFNNKWKDEKSNSKSLVSSISSDEFENQSLVFTYHNSGNTIKNIQPSNGTNILSIIERDKDIFLEGVYYTDRVPQTKGAMKVKLISKKLKRKF